MSQTLVLNSYRIPWRHSLQPLRRASILLLAWSLLYAIPHLYWGIGGTAAQDIYSPSAYEQSIWEVAHLFAFAFIALTGLLGFSLQLVRTPSLPRLALLAIIGAGCGVAASHGVFGMALRGASVAGMSNVDGVPFDIHQHAWVLWDMLVIEPWFLVEGLLLGLVGYRAQTSPRRKTLWLWAMAAAFLAFLATGLLGVRFA